MNCPHCGQYVNVGMEPIVVWHDPNTHTVSVYGGYRVRPVVVQQMWTERPEESLAAEYAVARLPLTYRELVNPVHLLECFKPALWTLEDEAQRLADAELSQLLTLVVDAHGMR